MTLRMTILGSGSSGGVPRVGGDLQSQETAVHAAPS